MKAKSYAAYGIVLVLVASLMIAKPVEIYAQALTVKVDKARYMTGESVTVSGKVSTIQPGVAITIQLINAKNARFDLDQVMPNEIAADGSFSKVFRLTGSEARLGPSGTWTVRVAYGDEIAETSFEFEAMVMPTALFVTIDGKRYEIDAELTNGVIKSVNAEPRIATLTFDVEMSDDGMFTLTLDRQFMDSLTEGCSGSDDVFVVLIDGQDEFPEESSTDGTRTVMINVPAGTTTIDVIGSCMVPEFGVIALLILAASVGTIVIASRKNMIRLGW